VVIVDIPVVAAITDCETNQYLVCKINDPKYLKGNVFVLLLTESFNKWDFFKYAFIDNKSRATCLRNK